MLLWIFLLVIGFLAVLFFFTQNRTGEDREVVLPPRPTPDRLAMDTEFAEEPGIDAELGEMTRDDLHRHDGMYDEETGEELFDLNLRKIPLYRDKARAKRENWFEVPVEEKISVNTMLSAFEMPIMMDLNVSLTALAKDPYWVHLYWTLPVDRPCGDWEIKVINLSQQEEFYEKVDERSGSWFLHLHQPEQRFIFELGIRDKYGFFNPILISNEIQTPSDRPSNIVDTDWMSIDELYGKKMFSGGSPDFIMEKVKGNSN